MTGGDRFGASLPSKAASASWKSPIETPRQIEDGQHRVQAPGAPGPAREHCRAEADALGPSLASAAVAQLHPFNCDRADAGLDQALRAVPVSDNALAPVRQLLALHLGQERVSFRLDGLGKQATRAAPQYGCQRVVERVGLTKWDNGAMARHGVSLLREVKAGFYPPRYAASLKSPSPNFRHSSTSKTRIHSLFRQDRMLYELSPHMPEHRLAPLIAAFNKAGSQASEFNGLLAQPERGDG